MDKHEGGYFWQLDLLEKMDDLEGEYADDSQKRGKSNPW